MCVPTHELRVGGLPSARVFDFARRRHKSPIICAMSDLRFESSRAVSRSRSPDLLDLLFPRKFIRWIFPENLFQYGRVSGPKPDFRGLRPRVTKRGITAHSARTLQASLGSSGISGRGTAAPPTIFVLMSCRIEGREPEREREGERDEKKTALHAEQRPRETGQPVYGLCALDEQGPAHTTRAGRTAAAGRCRRRRRRLDSHGSWPYFDGYSDLPINCPAEESSLDAVPADQRRRGVERGPAGGNLVQIFSQAPTPGPSVGPCMGPFLRRELR